MINKRLLGACAASALIAGVWGVARATPPANINYTVGVCDPWFPQRCLAPAADGSLAVTGSLTPSGTQDTNLKQVNGSTVNVGVGASGTGTPRVATATDSTIGTITNPVGVKGADGSGILSNANPAPVSDAGGSLTVDGTIAATQSGAWSVTPIPATTGGLTLFSQNITNTAGGTAVKGSAGQVYGYYFYNNNATVCYVQIWNVASPTVGTTAPVISMGIPANGGANMPTSMGLAFSTAITIGATTTRAGSSACTNGVDANVYYK